MSSTPSSPGPRQACMPSCNQLLVGFSLLCLLIAIFSSIGWLEARKEVRTMQTELQLTQCNLTDTMQQLEAERLISQRQIEMLRADQPALNHPALKDSAKAR